MSGDHNQYQKNLSYLDFECPRCGHCCYVDADDTSQDNVDEIVKCRHEWVGLTDEERHSIREGRFGAIESKANARLIAAGADLLEALQDVCARLLYRGVSTNAGHPDRTALEVARAAIAKATGGGI